MTNNIDSQFSGLKKQIADLKTQKARSEGELTRLNQEKLEILKSSEELGVDIKQLDNIVLELETDLQNQLNLLEEELNVNKSSIRQLI